MKPLGPLRNPKEPNESNRNPQKTKKIEMTHRGKPITRDAPGSAGHLKILGSSKEPNRTLRNPMKPY